MTVIIIGIAFIALWLVTTFFIVRYVKTVRNDLLARFSGTEKPPEAESESEYEEYSARQIPPPFEYINRADPKHLLTFIQQEHPQVIALVLAYLEPDKASVILRKLPGEVQSEVTRRIAVMDRVSPEIKREIERVLEKKLFTMSSEEYSAAGGIESVVEILNHTDSDSKDHIIKEFEKEDPELAEAITYISKTQKKFHRKFWEVLKRKSKPAVPAKPMSRIW